MKLGITRERYELPLPSLAARNDLKVGPPVYAYPAVMKFAAVGRLSVLTNTQREYRV